MTSHDPKFEQNLCAYLSRISGHKLESIRAIANLPSGDLLEIFNKIDDKTLYWTLSLLKHSIEGRDLFEKLMGSHEVENLELSQSFFSRYMEIILGDSLHDEGDRYYNPLVHHLPREVLSDLVFVQSRQGFFLRQTVETINHYLAETFGEMTHFISGEQEAAWNYFWQRLCADRIYP